MRSNSTLSSLALDVLFDSLESDNVPPSDTTTSTDMWSRHNLSTVEEITAYHQVMLSLMGRVDIGYSVTLIGDS